MVVGDVCDADMRLCDVIGRCCELWDGDDLTGSSEASPALEEDRKSLSPVIVL